MERVPVKRYHAAIHTTGGNMLFGNYQFNCLFTEPALLPPYKGSTFRGVFGRALKKTVCALRLRDCKTCLLKNNCLYALVFETADTVDSSSNSRIAATPHPFVIEPPCEEKTDYKEGEFFNFNLILFGEVNRSIPYFVYALSQMGTDGIGRKRNNTGGRFVLKDVLSGGKLVYSSENQKIETENAYSRLELKSPQAPEEEISRLRLDLITPLRLKFENRLNADLPFHVLIRAALRRVSSLFSFYNNGEPELDYRGLVKRAEEVCIKENQLKWYDWRRYSFRQEQGMLMGGITGKVVYEGKIAEFIPLLELCEKLHIGKQTAFGLGKFEMEIME